MSRVSGGNEFFPLITPKFAPAAANLNAQIISSFRLVMTNKQEIEPASHYDIES